MSSRMASSSAGSTMWNSSPSLKRSTSSKPTALFASCNKLPGTCVVADWLTDREDAVVSVKNVTYYREPMEGARRGVYHDFLVVELEPFEFQGRRVRSPQGIRAEKTNDGEEGGMIQVGLVEPDLPTTLVEEHIVDMQGCGRIQMSILLQILRDHNPAYDLCKNNCWKYGHDTLRNLVQHFLGLPDTRTERKTELQHFLTTFPPPDLPSNILGARLAKVFSLGATVLGTPSSLLIHFSLPISPATAAATPITVEATTWCPQFVALASRNPRLFSKILRFITPAGIKMTVCIIVGVAVFCVVVYGGWRVYRDNSGQLVEAVPA